MRPYRRTAVFALCASLSSVLINLAIPLQTARVIDRGVALNDAGFVRETVLIMVVLIVAGMAASALATVLAVRVAFNTVTDLRRDVYSHAQSFSFANLDRMATGEVLTRLTSDVSKITMVLSMGLSFIAQTPIMFVGSLAAIVILDASLAVIVLAMVPVIGVVVWYTLTKSGALYDAVQSRLDRLNTVLQENIQGTEVIKAFVRQPTEVKRFDGVADDLADTATKVNQLVAALMPTLIAVSSMGVAAVLWLGGNNVIEGSLTEGRLVAFISYLAMVAMPMMMFAFIQPVLSAAGASMNRIQEVLDEQPAVTNADNGIDLDEQSKPGSITFENVSFRYASSAENNGADARDDALCEVSLHIPQGQTIAILGATGSGKSTLVNLIPRFYDATAGTVRVGGVDVRQLSKASLRRSIGIALQQPDLFTGTMMENLLFGRPDATEAEAIDAAKAAQAHEFISALPDGYESKVEQGGANLSGGQRQRLAIARTLVVDPTILILDDSTSAVDLDTEARIQEALAAWSDRTVVLVAQRISTALGADVIAVIEDGRLVAHGTHDDLLADSDTYREIYQSQLGEPVR